MINTLLNREIKSKYRGSFLGTLWSLIIPLFNLAIYTFVFGTIFRAKWTGIDENASTTQFAVILFIGLAIHQLVAEVFVQAPTRIQSNQNYVKKVVFPLEILIPVTLGASLFNTLINFSIILCIMPFIFGGIPFTAIYLPLILLPVCLLCLGIGWFLASLGVFLRDIGQIINPIVMAMLFLAPIFFPISVLPEWLQPWIKLNPITIPVEQMHNILIYNKPPDFFELGTYLMIALSFAIFGYLWFQKTRKGFADVV